MASTRRLTTILAADVAGYSRLMGADEESVYVLLAVIRHDIKIGTIPGIQDQSFAPLIRHNSLSTAF
jgi:hypothetical protein